MGKYIVSTIKNKCCERKKKTY